MAGQRGEVTMRAFWLVWLLAVACNDPSPGAADLAAGDLAFLAGARDASGGCSPECGTTQFCYAGAETAFFRGDGGIQLGCNPLPAVCEHNCTCLLTYFQAGFCTCALDDHGVEVVHCSFA
jgi:hypothetical protein